MKKRMRRKKLLRKSSSGVKNEGEKPVKTIPRKQRGEVIKLVGEHHPCVKCRKCGVNIIIGDITFEDAEIELDPTDVFSPVKCPNCRTTTRALMADVTFVPA